MSKKISIVIPCYEMYGIGYVYLRSLFTTIKSQTYFNIEIITPDHSSDKSIEKEVTKWENKLKINHFFNKKGVGNSSINMNEGIKNATGDIIKIMHMDDFFCSENTLQSIIDGCAANPNKSWGVVGFNHMYSDSSNICRFGSSFVDLPIPRNVKIGVAGCPSTSFFLRNKNEPDLFDEKLVILNDKDMHLNLKKRYGDMIVVEDIGVTIRMHRDNFMKKVQDGKEEQERRYVNKKHGIKEVRKKRR